MLRALQLRLDRLQHKRVVELEKGQKVTCVDVFYLARVTNSDLFVGPGKYTKFLGYVGH